MYFFMYEFIYLFKMYLLFYFNSLHFKFDLLLMNYFSIFYILFFVLDFRALIINALFTFLLMFYYRRLLFTFKLC